MEIVKAQGEFFAKGPGHLLPLQQKVLAQKLGVHESTVSRAVNGKYIRCQWGLFELKYFFAAAIPGAGSSVGAGTSVGASSNVGAGSNISTSSTAGSDLESPDYKNTSLLSSSDTASPITKENVVEEIKKILKEHQSDGKKLSDQKISDLLAARGIKVARRTVAKYRGQLNIDSSYTRQ